jgi:hypothetical protein
VNPKNRPFAIDALQHPWFEKVIKGGYKGKDLSQAYRISGGILVLHGKDQTELELI